jgi:hypothetical protein
MKDTKDDNEFTFYSEVRSSRKMQKENILDESFKRAERSKGIITQDKNQIIKKQQFHKLGVIFIIISIVALAVINFLPWVFIKFDAEYGTIQEFYFRDFENKEGRYYPNEMDNIFESKCTNCSFNSKNYIGISKDDFTVVPTTTSYTFFVFIALGIIFTIISILNYYRFYSRDIISIIHSSFAASGIIIGTFIILLNIKFLSVHFLVYFNEAFIETSGASDIILIFFAPLFIIIISIAIILISLITININLREYNKRRKSMKNEETT